MILMKSLKKHLGSYMYQPMRCMEHLKKMHLRLLKTMHISQTVLMLQARQPAITWFEHFIIPDEITFGGMAAGLVCAFLFPPGFRNTVLQGFSYP